MAEAFPQDKAILPVSVSEKAQLMAYLGMSSLAID